LYLYSIKQKRGKKMKYIVTVYEVHSQIVEVEANSEEEARELASQMIEEEDYGIEYSYTMDAEDWTVEKVR
jgi:hypothetical protein